MRDARTLSAVRDRLLHLVAHRGNSADFPENTLPALRSAIALGVRFLEIDVLVSSDGIVMVASDERLASFSGGRLNLTADEIGALEAGQPERFGQRYRGTAVPDLESVLELLEGRPEITVFASIGRDCVARMGHEQVIARVVRSLRPIGSRCVLVSRDVATIHIARAITDIQIGWELVSIDGHARLKNEALKPQYVFCDEGILSGHSALWRGPWRWAIRTRSGLDSVLRLAERGADFAVTGQVRELGVAMRAHQTPMRSGPPPSSDPSAAPGNRSVRRNA